MQIAEIIQPIVHIVTNIGPKYKKNTLVYRKIVVKYSQQVNNVYIIGGTHGIS